MSYEFLQILWFILIAVLWIGFYFLEGFDFGVGMKTDPKDSDQNEPEYLKKFV